MDERVIAAATRVRAFLVAIPASEYETGDGDFPVGWCGHASELLCTYLNDREPGVGAFEHVWGERHRPKYQTHAWVEGSGVISDITADQFDPDLPGVWITADRGWHGQFSEAGRYQSDVRTNPDPFGWLPRLYSQLVAGDVNPPAS